MTRQKESAPTAHVPSHLDTPLLRAFVAIGEAITHARQIRSGSVREAVIARLRDVERLLEQANGTGEQHV